MPLSRYSSSLLHSLYLNCYRLFPLTPLFYHLNPVFLKLVRHASYMRRIFIPRIYPKRISNVVNKNLRYRSICHLIRTYTLPLSPSNLYRNPFRLVIWTVIRINRFNRDSNVSTFYKQFGFDYFYHF